MKPLFYILSFMLLCSCSYSHIKTVTVTTAKECTGTMETDKNGNCIKADCCRNKAAILPEISRSVIEKTTKLLTW